VQAGLSDFTGMSMSREKLPKKEKKTSFRKSGSRGRRKGERKRKKTAVFTKAVIFLLFLLAVSFLVYRFAVISEKKGLEQKCLEIQNDPMLKYPCRCVPTTRPDNPNDSIDMRTEPMCTCECDFGDAGVQVIEVRVAK